MDVIGTDREVNAAECCSEKNIAHIINSYICKIELMIHYGRLVRNGVIKE